MNYKEVLGLSAVIIGIISYFPYIRDIFANKTKPHSFSWLIWSILTGIGFTGQITDNAGAGSWVTGMTSIACFIIFIIALKKGEKNILILDWLCLIGAGVAILFWFILKGPLLSVLLVTLITSLGFIPTFRKSFMKPQEETVITFALNGFKFVPAIIALENFSLVTAIYPASQVITNWLLVLMLIIRRKVTI